jgi:hypothetical protein
MQTRLIAVIGDVHHHLWMAVAELARLELTHGRKIEQVFSVGDLGLFLQAEDWDFLTGPDKYRRTEDTERIKEAWANWRWPLSMIGGNHEPFNRLRDWDSGHFGHRLEYTDGGNLNHSIQGLRVYGLTGIARNSGPLLRGRTKHWSEILDDVRSGELSIKELTYYLKRDIDQILALSPRPDILLTHDWPFHPLRPDAAEERVERMLLELVRPQFHFAGHHHQHHVAEMSPTRFEALNIIQAKNNPGEIAEGWVRLLEWDGSKLTPI